MRYDVEIRTISYSVARVDIESTDIDDIMDAAWKEYVAGNIQSESESDENEIVIIYDDQNNEVWSL